MHSRAKKGHQLLLHTELATNSFHKLRVQYTSIFELVIKTLAERNGRVLRFIKRFSIDDSPAMCQTAGAFFTDFNFWPHFAAIAHVGIGFLWHLTQFETYRFEPWMCVGCLFAKWVLRAVLHLIGKDAMLTNWCCWL